jgi:peptidoglycan/xylan/chitin deacetylase (PgdA/CDA1 family)
MPRGAALYKKDPLASRSPLGRAFIKGRGRVLRALADTLPESVVFQHGRRTSRRIALTFDDGPGPMTEALLSVLDRAKARASFFVIGDECAPYKGQLADMARLGHDVCGHGWSHTRFTELGPGVLEDELARTTALLPPSPGRRLVRPPYGTMTPRSLFRTFSSGYASAMWSFDALDYTRESASEVVRAVDPAKLRNGDIVLLHEDRRTTLEAMPEIIERLRRAGFDLVTVTEVLRA